MPFNFTSETNQPTSTLKIRQEVRIPRANESEQHEDEDRMEGAIIYHLIRMITGHDMQWTGERGSSSQFSCE